MTTATMNRNAVKPSSTSGDVYADAPHSKSVMRQTQGLIGAVLLGGVAAAYFVSMTWVVVPVIIGLGLLFAGVSGMCPMASLVAHAMEQGRGSGPSRITRRLLRWALLSTHSTALADAPVLWEPAPALPFIFCERRTK